MAAPRSQIPAKAKMLPQGVYTPILSLYQATPRQEIDLDAMYAHCQHMLRAGVHGLVYQGTNGEAVLISNRERKSAIAMARKASTDLGYTDYPIVAGIMGESTNLTIEHAKDAAEAGANFALLLSPSYWRAAMTDEAILAFYREVADESPIPVVIYNFPAVTSGIDLNSDQIASMAEHPNIVACKLTCGNMGKINRLTTKFAPSQFSVFGGSSDYLIAGLESGTKGCVTALGNIFPASIVRVYELWHAGEKEKAKQLQGDVATVEWACKKGIAGTKYGAWRFVGKGLGLSEEAFYPRKPYLKPTGKEKEWVTGVLQILEKQEDSIFQERNAKTGGSKANGSH